MSPSPWRFVFFGTPAFALPVLKGLLEGPDEVAAVVTRPDRERGRGKKVSPSPVKELALRYGTPLLQPEKVKERSFLEAMKSLEPDLFVVVAFGQILPKPLLEIPRSGGINVHASLLPVYRGAAPIVWAILKGEKVTGITTMLMDEGMDTGDILMQTEIPIEEEDTGETLQGKLSSLGGRLLLETVEKMKTGSLTPLPQDHSKATYAPPLKKEDGRIDWKRPAEEIDRQVRAFNPWPGAFTRWENRLLKVYRGEVRKGISRTGGGSVVWVGSDFIEVETGSGSLLIREVQLEGRRRMNARDFLSGHSVPVGTVFH
ncbi:MAG: methionyl-tRNA formyltransferase [Deltaproteobacteria bacterium RBG_16_49_23]|nr:MAG: methionyl-tRNA formyltransferase [Deltaproteobacteria bacterium RBG_16_49_23]